MVAAGNANTGFGNARGRRQLSITIERPTESDTAYSSPQPSPRTRQPPPNPPFVFPARQSPVSAPSTFSKATGGRRRSLMDLQDTLSNSSGRARHSPALPDFTFNPAAQLSPESASNDFMQRSPALSEFSLNTTTASDPASSLMSPPLSPTTASPRMIPNRGGHRRGGSEFVGGKMKEGETITVMSTSPTRSDSGIASPRLAPFDNAARRVGHRHRRSAAISSHDLSMILKPPPNTIVTKGSSAPASPANFDQKASPFPDMADEPISPLEVEPKEQFKDEVTEEPTPAIEERSSSESSSTTKPQRAKVGFSDTLEYIPRPLSMMSTDTTSTVTGRQGHSVSNSITSIISLSNSIVTDRERAGITSSPVPNKQYFESRPSTAGAVLERTPSLLLVDESPFSPRRRNSIPLLTGVGTDVPVSPTTPSPSKVPKRWSFFGFDSFSSGSPSRLRPHSSSSSDTGPKSIDPAEGWSGNESSPTIEQTEMPAQPRKSKKKKQKKVKMWAGSILTRKSKSRSKKSIRRRSQTPPPPKGLYDDMDEDELEPGPLTAPMVMITGPSGQDDSESTKPRRKSEDDASYPMIDLDAALGPFNTPFRDPAWDAAQRAGAPPKRQLHSAAGLRGFSGPGMHYHRRSESAPEMPPFEGKFGIHRFGSSSTMADVFEEEEEEDHGASRTKTPSEDSTPEASSTSLANDAKSTSSESASTPTQDLELSAQVSRESRHSLSASIKRKGSGSSLELQPPGSRVRTEASISSLNEAIEEEDAVPSATAVDQERIYEHYTETDSAAPSPRRILSSNDLAPVDINPLSLPGPSLAAASPYSMSHASSFPSPRSPMSYDHRVSTAPSSVTEDNNFQSLLMGEPGPEVVRISVDVPSLTSSNSTMTRESNFPGVRPRNMPFHDQRPASFTSSAFGRRRSSLASLSRLISTSHGERSKLSMEVPVEGEAGKKAKVSTAKRLSRMMQFWKTKEPTTS